MKTLGEFNKELKYFGYKATLEENYIVKDDKPTMVLWIKDFSNNPLNCIMKIDLDNKNINLMNNVSSNLTQKISEFVNQYDVENQLFYIELGQSHVRDTSLRYYKYVNGIYDIKEFNTTDEDVKMSYLNICDMESLLKDLKNYNNDIQYSLINRFSEEYVKYI